MCRYMGIYIDLIGMSQKEEKLTNTICTCSLVLSLWYSGVKTPTRNCDGNIDHSSANEIHATVCSSLCW